MPYKTGKSKSLDDITLDDVLKNTIWEWALDEEGVEGQDETWQRPIIDTDNVTNEIYNPTITIKIKDTDIHGSAQYDKDTKSICAICIWEDNKWKGLNECKIAVPLTIVSVPKIEGVKNISFLVTDLSEDKAYKI